MHFKSKIAHIEIGKAIVIVTGWDNQTPLGSAIGEAKSFEEAEDRAIKRLKTRNSKYLTKDQNKIQTTNLYESNKEKLSSLDKTNNSISLKKPKESLEKHYESKAPDDWSSELGQIDAHLKRLNWDKESEKKLLNHIFGYEDRYKVTSYIEIETLLNKLNAIKTPKKIDDYILNLKKDDLIQISNSHLQKLSWDEKEGRDFLRKNFDLNSRKDMNIEQLITFNNQLEDILDKSTSVG